MTVQPGDSILDTVGSDVAVAPSDGGSATLSFQNICASLGTQGCAVSKPENPSLTAKVNEAAVNADQPKVAMAPEPALAPALQQQQNITPSNS